MRKRSRAGNMGIMETKNLAIMFTDMKGYTSLSSSLSRAEIHYLLGTQQSIVSTLVKQHKGNVIKNLGDGYLTTFASPTNAVLCGVKIQQAVGKHNVSFPQWAFELRVAINSGEVTIKDGDIFGDPVNTAARILAVAPPGGVYLTDSVFLSMNKNEVPSAEVGAQMFKGVPEPIKIYRVVTDASEVGKLRQFRLGLIAAVSNLGKEEGEKGSGHVRRPFSAKNLKYGFLIIAFLLALANTFPKRGAGFTRSMRDSVEGIGTESGQLATPSASLSSSPSPTATSSPKPTIRPSPTPTPSLTPTPSKKPPNKNNHDKEN